MIHRDVYEHITPRPAPGSRVTFQLSLAFGGEVMIGE